MLKKRILTGAAFTAVIALVYCFYGVPYVLNFFALALSLCGIYELYHINNIERRSPAYIISVLWAIICCLAEQPYYYCAAFAVLLAVVILFACLMVFYGKYKINKSWQVFLLSLIFPVLFYAFAAMGKNENGLFYLILSVGYCFLNEIAAFFIGRKFGRHKLIPKISPAKTVEGSIGGTLASMLLAVLAVFVFDYYTAFTVNYLLLVLYLFLASAAGQLGDLSMSALKRNAGVKDFGNTLPGHGGVLDRFDGILFAVPFTYLFVSSGGAIIC